MTRELNVACPWALVVTGAAPESEPETRDMLTVVPTIRLPLASLALTVIGLRMVPADVVDGCVRKVKEAIGPATMLKALDAADARLLEAVKL